MCSLQAHIDRDAKIQEGRRREPIYAELTDKYLLPYEPPEGPHEGPFSCPETGA